MPQRIDASGPWEYFSKKVHIDSPDKCWPWKGSPLNTGYGSWSYGKRRTAHRATFELFFGSTDLQINHACGNRMCCNPDHLYAGTQKENIQDAIRHGTFSPPPSFKGELNHKALLTAEQVKEIRCRLSGREKGCQLAREYGVTTHAISAIKRRKTWAWL